jgi:hypothetical protein
VNNPYDGIRHIDYAGSGMQAFQQGMQLGNQVASQNALSKYAENPNDPEAMTELMKRKPEMAMQLKQQQQAQQRAALEQRREDFLLGGQIFRQIQPKDEASYQAALQAYQRAGGNMADVPTQFDPNYVQGVVSVADALKPVKQNEGPSSVQEYEYAKQQGFGGSYMEFMEEKRGPIVANNGDGTFTLIPRGAMGGQQPGAVPPPPPGFVIDGGPTPPASGGFPDPLAPR